ncbi:Uncharacterized membrane protein [Amycolatopsis xylanica]|uniref:Uncharacterized membrane protein n=1 Tax=Amycolatopsis xylanica TaxID=589385 RepID=A0A1H3JAM1_9PSEU|nr:DUF2306 domain-containing protein [Amycolatopsis xylanica]SDY36877.1 Uncharacterized membrane protein [Amycolatopsis xylanica]
MATRTAAAKKKSDWRILTGLLLLCAFPIVAGSTRVAELSSSAPVTPENARFFAVPLPVIVHIVAASLYCVVGAFQFAPGLRRRRLGLHRVSGRALVPLGLAAALSGLWMTFFYPSPPGDGALLFAFRIFFGSGMVVALVLGTVAVLRRDIRRHRGWMIRGYAIGMGAGTQVFTHLPWAVAFGAPGEFTHALLMAAGWVINLAVAEWVIGRTARPAALASHG